MNKIVAIHQPNFFPWLGFFDKLSRCDVFILLDNVQFPKTGGTWTNRVRLLINGTPAWVTAPIVRAYHGTRCISEMQINESNSWREKLARTIHTSYANAPCFKEVFPHIEPLIHNPTNSLFVYNHSAIVAISGLVGIQPDKIILGSSLNISSQSTDMLVEMTQVVGGTVYLSGNGAGEYQEEEKFKLAGLSLIFQNSIQQPYPQIRSEKFVPGLSILDALFHVGVEQVRGILNKPIQKQDSR